jgi:hypothetical protein
MLEYVKSVDPENELVLIICASGKQASTLVPVPQGEWKRLRLAVHSDQSTQHLCEKHPDAEVVQANLVNPTDTKRIMNEVSAVYHVGPTGNPYETQCGYNMIGAAVAGSQGSTFKHFILSSVFPT